MNTTKTMKESALWLTGIAGTTCGSNAAVVQIDLIDNFVASTTAGGIGSLSADITENATLTIAGSHGGTGAFLNYNNSSSFVASAYGAGPFTRFAASTGGGPNPGSVSGFITISFTDAGINGGAPTSAWLGLTATNVSAMEHFVALGPIIFDDASTDLPSPVARDTEATLLGSVTYTGVNTNANGTAGRTGTFNPVPEPSGLALLAMGAAGITVRRQRKKSA